jgi:hypothetical protein
VGALSGASPNKSSTRRRAIVAVPAALGAAEEGPSKRSRSVPNPSSVPGATALRSPGARRRPSSQVPFVLPRSSSAHSPSAASRVSRAWTLERTANGSGSSRSARRPMRICAKPSGMTTSRSTSGPATPARPAGRVSSAGKTRKQSGIGRI